MAAVESETEYKRGFILRVKQARNARGAKQWEIAEALGMPQDHYKQYEGRTLLPLHLITRFCIICRVDARWLVTGHGQMIPQETPAAPVHKAVAKARRRTAA